MEATLIDHTERIEELTRLTRSDNSFEAANARELLRLVYRVEAIEQENRYVTE